MPDIGGVIMSGYEPQSCIDAYTMWLRFLRMTDDNVGHRANRTLQLPHVSGDFSTAAPRAGLFMVYSRHKHRHPTDEDP